MKVIIAAGIYPPDIGGPATYAHALVRHLLFHQHEVRVLSYGDSRAPADTDATEVIRISRNLPKLISYWLYFWKLFKAAGTADIIYAQGPSVGGLHAFIVSRIRQIPYVVKVTGDYAWEQYAAQYQYTGGIDAFQKKSTRLPIKVSVLKYIQSLVTRHARTIIVPSKYLRKIVLGWGVSPGAVSVIYNAVHSVDDSERDPGISGSYVVSVARLVPWKGLDTLIRLWPKIQESIPKVQLVICGDGPEKEKLIKLAENSQCRDSIQLVGRKTRSELASYLKNASVFVLNSSYEGLSHVLLEAQHAGIPVAVSRVGGNSELVSHKKTGLLFGYNNDSEIVDAIVLLLSNQSQAEQLARAAKEESAKFFDYDGMLDETEALLRSLVA